MSIVSVRQRAHCVGFSVAVGAFVSPSVSPSAVRFSGAMGFVCSCVVVEVAAACLVDDGAVSGCGTRRQRTVRYIVH